MLQPVCTVTDSFCRQALPAAKIGEPLYLLQRVCTVTAPDP